MRRNRKAVWCVVSVVASCAIGATAQGQAIEIIGANGAPVANSTYTAGANTETGAWTIELRALYSPGGLTVYDIIGTGGVVIDHLRINVPCWQFGGSCVPAGSPVIVRVLSGDDEGVRSIHQISQPGDAETILADVVVREDIGEITVESIGILEAGRDIHGPIVATTEDNPVRGISKVSAARDILGDLITENGRILEVQAARHIGAEDQPVTIRAKHGHAFIRSTNELHAQVQLGVNDGSGYLWFLDAGSFHGTLHAPRLAAAEGAPGFVRFLTQFTGKLVFDEGFTDPAQTIQVPLFGLEGQIVFNASAAAAAAWSAPVRIGPNGHPDQIVLNGPGYTVPSEAIGGGSVGLVPFSLHGESSSPARGATVKVADRDPPVEVRLDHYGPVLVTGDSPVIIERRSIGEEGNFEAVSPDEFTMALDSSNPRRLVIGASPAGLGFAPGYDYRMMPTASLVNDVPAQPAVQWNEAYTVRVEQVSTGCAADLTGDGTVNVFDLLALLGQWGDCDAAPDAGCAADLSGDGTVNVFDLLELLAQWGDC